jgi:hypothetical protein
MLRNAVVVTYSVISPGNVGHSLSMVAVTSEGQCGSDGMSKKQRLNWRPRPVAADLNAAARFLSLINTGNKYLAALRRNKAVDHAAKRPAAGEHLALLPRDEPQVEADLKRFAGKVLSPVLLVVAT